MRIQVEPANALKLTFHLDKIFRYVNNFSDEINVYILDTGVFAGHSDFENRVIKSVDLTGEGLGDSNGHGMFFFCFFDDAL